MRQTGYVVDMATEGKEVVISKASADCKKQSVLRTDGYGEMMEVLHKLPRHKETAAMFSNEGLLFLYIRKIFLIICSAVNKLVVTI